jgi:hypothetical protein
MPTTSPRKKRTPPKPRTIPKPKAKRKRRGRYITGTHTSAKSNGLVKYRSGWELSVLEWLDTEPTVQSYLYESFKIPYLANAKTGKVRNYIPDFLITYTNGVKKVVEVKRQDKVNQPKTAKKLAAGKLWCDKNNLIFEVWTDEVIKQIRSLPKLINEQSA